MDDSIHRDAKNIRMLLPGIFIYQGASLVTYKVSENIE